MEPPRHIVDALYRIDPSVRLGWGPPPKPQRGKTLPPKFGLILLRQPRAPTVVTGDDWRDRGPVFGKPYDRLAQTPIVLAFYSPEAVFGGSILKIAKDRIEPHSIVYAMRQSARAAAKRYDEQVTELAHVAGEELAWRAKQPDAASPEPVPAKHLTQEERDILAGTHESQRPLTDVFDDCVPT